MARPVLYSFRRCPYAMRARLALLASETICEIREVKLSAKPAEMIVASPKGTVPVLVLANGEVLDESLGIMRWALERSNPQGWLHGADAALIAANDGPFKHHLDRYKYPERHASDPVAHRTAALGLLQALDQRLIAQPHLAGPRRGLADAAIMPFVRQFAAVDRAWFDAQDLPALQRWLADYLASPTFTAAMVRLAPWRPGDEPLFFGVS